MKLKEKLMVDIAKCDGEQCELAEACYRYQASADDLRQSYMIPKVRGLGCTYFWPLINEPEG